MIKHGLMKLALLKGAATQENMETPFSLVSGNLRPG